MNVRAKKFVGTVATVVFLLIYSLLVMRLAVGILPGLHAGLQLGFYFVAGLAWVVPVGALIAWMQRD